MPRLPLSIYMLCAFLQAQSDSPANASEKLAGIEGKVVHSLTGQSIARAEVKLIPLTSSDAAPYVATTDGEGHFQIPGVDPGRFQLAVARRGFLIGKFGGRRESPSSQGTVLSLAAGQRMSGIEVRLIPQGVIAGRVLDDLGEPADRVRIEVQKGRGSAVRGASAGTVTNDLGEYRIAGLEPGRYRVWAEPVTGLAGLLTARGKPGAELIRTFYPGVLRSAEAGVIEVAAGQEVQSLDFRLVRANLFRIRGKVTGFGPPAAGISGLLVGRDSERLSSFDAKPDGSFVLNGVSAGRYTLVATNANTTLAGRTDLVIADGDLDDVVVSLGPCSVLTGSVVLKQANGKTVSLAGLAKSGPRIRARLLALESPLRETQSVQLSADGRFSFDHVPAGRYRLNFDQLPPELWVDAVRFGGEIVPPAGFAVGQSISGEVEVTLGTGFGRVSGLVRDSEQRPLAGASVAVVPEGEEQLERFRLVTADQDGRFESGPLPPGEYRVYAWAEVEHWDAVDPEFLKKFEGTGRKVRVKLEGEERVDLGVK